MLYMGSYLLAILGGNDSPNSKDLTKILDNTDIETEDERLKKVISELNGKNTEDVITQGSSKLASMPAGGAVADAASAGSTAPAVGSAAPAAEEKKEEKKEESEESHEDMGFGLFEHPPSS
uniref:Large ribosomal subunit protein P2 n=1 Tax=Vombatus ursinus TaxID=29139 RepID=A0A4X2M2D4_VOMUR